jgi:hypothetical protein
MSTYTAMYNIICLRVSFISENSQRIDDRKKMSGKKHIIMDGWMEHS